MEIFTLINHKTPTIKIATIVDDYYHQPMIFFVFVLIFDF